MPILWSCLTLRSWSACHDSGMTWCSEPVFTYSSGKYIEGVQIIGRDEEADKYRSDVRVAFYPVFRSLRHHRMTPYRGP